MADQISWETLTASQLVLPFITDSQALPVQEKNGVVYTKPWVARLLLDLAGYTEEADLVNCLAIEPAAGNGAFLIPMVQRLVTSCKLHNLPLANIAQSLLAYELHETNVAITRSVVTQTLIALGISHEQALHLACEWIRVGNYLFDAPNIPSADFVIGNPPYIRLEDIDDALIGTYRAMYRTMRGRSDIYVAFFEAALRRLKSNGVCAFICADRWMFNQYGSELRQHVTQGFSIETVIQMHHVDAFAQSVNAYPAVTIIRRTKQGPVVVGSLEASAETSAETSEGADLAVSLKAIRSGGSKTHVSANFQAARVETWFTGTDPWPCVSPERLALLRQLEDQFPPLEATKTETKVGIGVATGLDEVFITTNPVLVEPSRLLPLAMVADTTGGHFHWSGHYLIDPWEPEGLVELKQFPRLQKYFMRYEDHLKKRHTARQNPPHWYRTIDRVNHALMSMPKLYFPDIQLRINPVLDKGKTYPHHNLYFVSSGQWDIEVLGGLLMSAIGQFFVECYGVRMRGGYYRFQAQYLRRIRVPRMQDITPDQATTLIEAFRRRDVALATHVALDIYRIRELPVEDIYK